jgi:nucleotide-binding universal stress UspA family protein
MKLDANPLCRHSAKEKRSFMKLLLPIDHSNASMYAAHKAAELSKNEGYDIKMICVIQPKEIKTWKHYARLIQLSDGSLLEKSVRPVDDADAFYKLSKRAAGLLDSVAEKIDVAPNRLQRDIIIGKPYDTILDAVKRENVSMLVVGSSVCSSKKKLMRSSIVRRLAADAPCPVLVVRNNQEKSLAESGISL